MTKQKSGSRSRRRKTGQWRTRVSERYMAWWRAQKNNRRLGQISDKKEFERAFRQNFKELALASRQFHQERLARGSSAQPSIDILAPLDGEAWPWPIGSTPQEKLKRIYVQNPEADSIFRTLAFLKYGLTFRELILQVETDPKAHQKLLNIHRDWYRLRWKHVSVRDLKLKFNMDHFGMISQGLDFGLKELDEWELAECLDEICPCSQRHSAEYLKKLRARIIKTRKTRANQGV